MFTIKPPHGDANYATISPSQNQVRVADLPADALVNPFETYGAVLFRGFDCDLDGFREFARAQAPNAVFNESGKRETVDDASVIQTVNLGVEEFPLHPELSRAPWRPDVAIFACQRPSTHGGRTTICDGAAIVKALSPKTRAFLEGRSLRYREPASPAVLTQWFGTATPSLDDLLAPPESCPFAFEVWDGKVYTVFETPVLYRPPTYDGPVFGNFLLFSRYLLNNHGFPVLDDDRPVPAEIMREIKEVSDRLTTAVPWRAGDVLMLDNWRFMHGRQSISDPETRRILTYFGYRDLQGHEPDGSAERPWRKLPPGVDWRPRTVRLDQEEPVSVDSLPAYASDKIEDKARRQGADEEPAPDLTLEALFNDARLYLFDLQGSNARFRLMSADDFRRSIFLDNRISCKSNRIATVPLSVLTPEAATLPTPQTPPHFVFHIAHCGSTLLANAIQAFDGALVLREPLALRQAGVHHANHPAFPEADRSVEAIVDLLTKQYAKTFAPDQKTVIKANVPVNFAAQEVLKRSSNSRAIMLHLPLEAYLLAVLKSDEHRRWVLTIVRELGKAIGKTLRVNLQDMAELTIPQAAAMLWAAQIKLFEDVMAAYPATTMSLDAERLFEDPARVLAAVDGFLQLGGGPETVSTVAEGPVMKANAKRPDRPFTAQDRERERAEKRDEMKDDLDEAKAWFYARVETLKPPRSLPRPMAAGAPLY